MKHTEKIGGKAKTADAIAATNNNISYVVRLEIRHFDENRKCTILVDEQTPFKGKRAIDCRKEAFKYAYQLTLDADIEGKLCSNHLDSPEEASAKEMKNFTALSVEIDCVDEKSVDRITISEADFFNVPEDLLGDCEAELMWYKQNGYDTDDYEVTVEDEDGELHQILDYGMIEKKGNIGFNRYFIQAPISDFEKVKVVYVVDHFHLTSKTGTFAFPEVQSKEFFDPDPIVARRMAFEYALSTISGKTPIDNIAETIDDHVELPKESSRSIILTKDWCTVSFIEYGVPGLIQVYFEGHNEHSAPFLAYELKVLKKLGYAKDAETVTVLDEDGVSYDILAEDNCLQEYKTAV